MESLKISIYSWNSASILINEKLDPEEQIAIEKARYSSMFTSYIWETKVTGLYADFIVPIKEEIVKQDPDIVFFASQESAKPGDHFHSDLLPEEMRKIGYKLVKRSRFIGAGITTVKTMVEEYSLKGRGLRNSVYARENMADRIIEHEKDYRREVGDDFQRTYNCGNIALRNKGGLASYLKIEGYDLIALINCHLPFNSSSLMQYALTSDPFVRKTAVMETDMCFNKIIRDLVYSTSGGSKELIPKNIFIAGDLNYRVTFRDPGKYDVKNLLRESGLNYVDYYTNYDELKHEKDVENIYHFNEGIEGEGPKFMPTCKMIKNRNPGSTKSSDYKTGKSDQRLPSWCDRILYNSMNSGPITDNIKCVLYDRYDFGSMINSDHAGVKAVFEVSPQK